MASNLLPTNCGELINLGNLMAGGLSLLGTALGITQITAAQMTTAVEEFADAETIYVTARSGLANAYGTYRAQDEVLGKWLSDARGVLTVAFGPTWSNLWLQAGFTNSSTSVPRGVVERITLAASLENFFTANPTKQATAQQVTAGQAGEVRSNMVAAQLAVQGAKVSMESKKATRESACMVLRTKMRLLISTLAAILGRNDARWGSFGLSMPGADTTPGEPQNVVASAVAGGAILVQCDPVPLAKRYRWRVRVVGVQTEFALAASTTTPLAEITGMLPGQTAQIIVQAVNGSSQGVASEPILVPVLLLAPVPPASAPKAAVAPLVQEIVEPELPVAPSTNGTYGEARENGSALAGAR